MGLLSGLKVVKDAFTGRKGTPNGVESVELSQRNLRLVKEVPVSRVAVTSEQTARIKTEFAELVAGGKQWCAFVQKVGAVEARKQCPHGISDLKKNNASSPKPQ